MQSIRHSFFVFLIIKKDEKNSKKIHLYIDNDYQ